MRDAESTSDIRFLTDSETDHIGGGMVGALIVAGLGAIAFSAAAYWDLPVGRSVDQAKAIAVPWL